MNISVWVSCPFLPCQDARYSQWKVDLHKDTSFVKWCFLSESYSNGKLPTGANKKWLAKVSKWFSGQVGMRTHSPWPLTLCSDHKTTLIFPWARLFLHYFCLGQSGKILEMLQESFLLEDFLMWKMRRVRGLGDEEGKRRNPRWLAGGFSDRLGHGSTEVRNVASKPT